MTATKSFEDLIIATQKELLRATADNMARQLSEFDKLNKLFPKPSGDIHLPILEPDKAMTVKQMIEKLSALDGDLKV